MSPPSRPREWDAAAYDALALAARAVGAPAAGGAALGAVLDPLPPGEHPAVVRDVAARRAEPVVDDVRLQAAARRAP